MASTLVFFGIEETTPICIKFVRRYSSEAHLFCASRGFAPKLKGFDKLAGGWYMVVMENISDDYRQAETYQSCFWPLGPIRQTHSLLPLPFLSNMSHQNAHPFDTSQRQFQSLASISPPPPTILGSRLCQQWLSPTILFFPHSFLPQTL